VRFNENARLDASQVQDRRRGGLPASRGGRAAVGGGGLGIVGVIVVVLLTQLGGGSGSSALLDGLGSLQQGQQASPGDLQAECDAVASTAANQDCRLLADINSVQGYWAGQMSSYVPADTVFFSGSVRTACGSATSAAGPFYCPGDQLVYLDADFFRELETRFGARGGPLVEAYVLAHEYGHHVQGLLGTNARVTRGETGPASGSVRLELQADCYAGAWVNHATTAPGPDGQPLILEVTNADVASALDTAARIGDDYIQTQLGGGTVDPESFSHGTSAQRQRWFDAGYRSGDPNRCDTFSTDDLG
jgi:predicted metalloprotease